VRKTINVQIKGKLHSLELNIGRSHGKIARENSDLDSEKSEILLVHGSVRDGREISLSKSLFSLVIQA
jgi:hypothetical protein